MIIVSGWIRVRPEDAEAFLADSRGSIVEARRAPGCADFVVAPDPLEAGRINVYERWDSMDAVMTFRGDGPGADLTSLIVDADVAMYEVASVQGA